MTFNIFSAAKQFIFYGCVTHCMFEYVGDFVVCSGPSMEPTIHSKDILLTRSVALSEDTVQKGQIIIAKCPTNPSQQICKRIVGLPGEKVRTGFAHTEIIPRGHIWLEGDNSSNSTDSRVYGPVPLGLVRSKVVMKVWPLKNMMLL